MTTDDGVVQVYAKYGDEPASWEALGATLPIAGVAAFPVLFLTSGNTVVPFAGFPANRWASQPDVIGPTDLIELDIADPTNLNVLTTSDYLITLFAQARLDINTTVDTPGTATVTTAISVNGENAGPAWDFYPPVPVYLVESGQYFPPLTLSFPQHLIAGDVVQGINGGALGSAVLTDGGYYMTTGYISFTKIG